MIIAYLANASVVHTVRWANEMVKRGHKIVLITMTSPRLDNQIAGTIAIHVLPIRGKLGYYLNVWHVRRLLKIIRPDLLHVHYASGYGTLGRLCNFHPVLLSVWGSDVYIFPYESEFKKRIFKKNLLSADYIASTSHAMKNELEKFITPKSAVTVTPFGVDCEQFQPQNDLRRTNEFVIGSVKTLDVNYGIEHLIKAFAILDGIYGRTKQLRLIIAGDGPLRNNLTKLAASLGVDEKTEFLGHIPHKKVPAVLNTFSVYVALSNSESFGVAVLEASACCLPVVVSDVGGLPEVVTDNSTGFVVPAADPKSAAEAIGRLIENEDLRINMGTKGREFVMKTYEWNNCANQVERLYQKIIIQGNLR